MAKIDEFNSWWIKHLEQQQFKPTQPLYHYTDAAGLLGILQTGQVWFTSMYHVNDPSEVHFGRQLAIQALLHLDGGLGEFCEDYQQQISRRDFRTKFEPFVACFSREPNTLGQWRAYGDNGRGFAIGLKPGVFEANETELKGDNYWVTDVGKRQNPDPRSG
jgi:hypothetical protein